MLVEYKEPPTTTTVKISVNENELNYVVYFLWGMLGQRPYYGRYDKYYKFEVCLTKDQVSMFKSFESDMKIPF